MTEHPLTPAMIGARVELELHGYTVAGTLTGVDEQGIMVHHHEPPLLTTWLPWPSVRRAALAGGLRVIRPE